MRLQHLVFSSYLLLGLHATSFFAQVGSNPENDTSTSQELQHALRHLDELSKVADLAAPTPELRKELDQETMPSVIANFRIMASDTTLPESAHEAAKEMLKTKHIDDMSGLISRGSLAEAMSTNNSGARIPLENTAYTVFQVETTQLPAMSIKSPTETASGLSNITKCTSASGAFFPRISQEMKQNLVAIRKLSDSVGRIEVKVSAGVPTLYGTGFVVDQQKGIIATACHVAYDVADYDSSSKTWTLPSKAFGNSSQVMVDFGFTDDHEPQNEFRVTGIAFVPMVTGCDGALLRVDTSTKPLPAALPLATTQWPLPLSSIVDVFSIGYPSRELSLATPESRNYFTCIRNSDRIAAKFAFGGEVTSVEPEVGYQILTHIIPTVGGQSGSPVIQILSDSTMQVVGIHICCTQSAYQTAGPSCELRNEPFLQEAVSIVDIVRLAHDQGNISFSSLKPMPSREEVQSNIPRPDSLSNREQLPSQ